MREKAKINRASSVEARLDSLLKETDSCLEWTGRLNDDGYGETKIEGRVTRVHKYVFQTRVGDVPDGMCVCHKCDNRKCCNPKHLFLDTNAGNQKDKVTKGRQSKGEEHGRSRLSDEDVLLARDLHRTGTGVRTIAKMLGVGRTTITHLLRGDTWRHLDEKTDSVGTDMDGDVASDVWS